MGIIDHIKAGAKNARNLPESLSKLGAKKTPSPAVARDAHGRVLPGQTLNPGGRPKGVESQLRGMLERANFDHFIEECISGENGADLRLRWEIGRWAHERANGKALERAQNVNVTLDGGQAPMAIEKLSDAELSTLGQLLQKGAPQLPPGDVVDAEFRSNDLPSTDIAADAEQKNKP